jgi:hypothetical protein
MDTNILPFSKYLLDSAKFYIDRDKFESVNIPQNFLLTDSETGEFIDEFKKNSLSVTYKNHKVYISNVVKTLGRNDQKFMIEKVLIYFPAKVSDNYFNGISKEDVINVLEFLKSKGYLIYSDVDFIFNQIYVKDLDIKLDMKFKVSQKIEILEYFGMLKDRFNGNTDDFHSFNNQKNGFGIQCFNRATAKLTKPFFKFYDKSKEVKKDIEFFNSFDELVRDQLTSNFVLRFEFTMKDKSYFTKYGVSNRLEDIFLVDQEKWQHIGRQFLAYAFDKPLRMIDTSKLKLKDRIQINQINLMIEKGITKNQLFAIYIKSCFDRKEKSRVKKEFEKIWSLAVTPSDYTKETMAIVERVKKWDSYFGLS